MQPITSLTSETTERLIWISFRGWGYTIDTR
jgi:hypothetical protein